MRVKIIIKITLLLSLLHINIETKKLKKPIPALVSIPVKDLIGLPAKTIKHKKQDKAHTIISLAPGKSGLVCKRLHQLICNEIVQIIKIKKDEVKVHIPNMFYIKKKKNKRYSAFWTDKKNLILLETLKKKQIDMSKIPKPICINKNIEQSNKNIATLKLPFDDPKNKRTFSVGTRFVKTKNQKSNNSFEVFAFDPQACTLYTMVIPKTVCIETLKNSEQKRVAFVNILKQWANRPQGYIPYVWGGSSFTHSRTKKRKKYRYNRDKYVIPNDIQPPASGFDCSGLILRAAQICNINYFYKNTYTLKKYLQPITQITELQNGDLIYYSGHVMIVSDIQNNTMIEAKVNTYDISKVQEIKLIQAFQGIKTYNDLFTYTKKKSINRLDITGNIIKQIKKGGIRFFKLMRH